jgi:hypothetical protein
VRALPGARRRQHDHSHHDDRTTSNLRRPCSCVAIIEP